MHLIDYSHSFLSVGILVGVAFLVGGSPIDGLTHLKDMVVGLAWADGDWSLGKPKILIFLLLLGIFTSLLTFSGSNQAFADWAKQHIKGRRGAKMLTAISTVSPSVRLPAPLPTNLKSPAPNSRISLIPPLRRCAY